MAAEQALRECGIPALDLWETVLQRPVSLTLLEDNQTTAHNIRTGKFPKLRHIQRMHGVNIRWLHEALTRGIFRLEDCHTQRMSADIFTKHFVNADSWNHATRLLGFFDSTRMKALQSCSVVQKSRSNSQCQDEDFAHHFKAPEKEGVRLGDALEAGITLNFRS